MVFPLDRMIAILGVLLEENDADVRPPAPEYSIPGEYTEMEISRVAIYALVSYICCSRDVLILTHRFRWQSWRPHIYYIGRLLRTG